MIGIPELLLILAIVLIVFGAGKLPEIGEAFGKGIRAFKSAQSGKDQIDVTPSAERLEEPAHRKGPVSVKEKAKVAIPVGDDETDGNPPQA